MLQTIIVDQQPPMRSQIRDLLGTEDFQVAAECENGQQAIDAIALHDPDLVVLEVPTTDFDISGLIEQVGRDRMPPVIFTAFGEQHALDAIEADAVDYLLKPFEEHRFQRALDRARLRCQLHRLRHLTQNLEQLLDHALPALRRSRDRLAVRNQGSVHLIHLDEIHWIEAARNYVKIHCGDTEHVMRETLSRLETRLDPERFLRIHRSTIVHIDRLRKIEPGLGSEAVAVLDDGTRLMISRAYRRNGLKELLDPEE